MRIRNLEEELNLTLIQRGQRFEGFTPEGERILAWARAVLPPMTAWRRRRPSVAGRWSASCGSVWCRWRASTDAAD
jgi:DNA-binding transcriptional LysR family regulator